MILSAKKIKKCVQEGIFQIESFNEKNLKGASYTFTLGSKILRFRDNQVLRAGNKPQYEEISIPDKGYTLKPNEFIIGFTKERLKLKGKYACLLSSRRSCAEMGLNILLSDVFAEPDTDNVLSLAILNISSLPIVLFKDMIIIKGIFTPIE